MRGWSLPADTHWIAESPWTDSSIVAKKNPGSCWVRACPTGVSHRWLLVPLQLWFSVKSAGHYCRVPWQSIFHTGFQFKFLCSSLRKSPALYSLILVSNVFGTRFECSVTEYTLCFLTEHSGRMTALCAAAMKFGYEVGSCAAMPFALPLSVFPRCYG